MIKRIELKGATSVGQRYESSYVAGLSCVSITIEGDWVRVVPNPSEASEGDTLVHVSKVSGLKEIKDVCKPTDREVCKPTLTEAATAKTLTEAATAKKKP